MFRSCLQSFSFILTTIMVSSSPSYAAPYTVNDLVQEPNIENMVIQGISVLASQFRLPAQDITLNDAIKYLDNETIEYAENKISRNLKNTLLTVGKVGGVGGVVVCLLTDSNKQSCLDDIKEYLNKQISLVSKTKFPDITLCPFLKKMH